MRKSHVANFEFITFKISIFMKTEERFFLRIETFPILMTELMNLGTRLFEKASITSWSSTYLLKFPYFSCLPTSDIQVNSSKYIIRISDAGTGGARGARYLADQLTLFEPGEGRLSAPITAGPPPPNVFHLPASLRMVRFKVGAYLDSGSTG